MTSTVPTPLDLDKILTGQRRSASYPHAKQG